MNKQSKIRAFSSRIYLLGRIESFILIFIPLLLRETISSALCFTFSALFTIMWIYYMLSTDAVIFVDAEGISCRRLFRKTVRLKWNDIVCSGTFKKAVYGKEIGFRYFSAKRIKPETLNGKASLPKLSENLIFAVGTPELDALVKMYSPKSADNRIISADTEPDETASADKRERLAAADILLLCAALTVFFLRSSLPRLWLPLLAVLGTASVVISAILVYRND